MMFQVSGVRFQVAPLSFGHPPKLPKNGNLWGQNRNVCEGVKQIWGWTAEEKNFFIPLAGGNDLHFFTNGLDTPRRGYSTTGFILKNVDFYSFFVQKMAFLRRCEIALFTVVLFLLRKVSHYAQIVKVANVFASLCEGRPSLNWFFFLMKGRLIWELC